MTMTAGDNALTGMFPATMTTNLTNDPPKEELSLLKRALHLIFCSMDAAGLCLHLSLLPEVFIRDE